MIESLDDAWAWYTAVRMLAYDMKRLAGKRDYPAVAAVLDRDKTFQDASASDLIDRANTVLGDLDDLAVLVLFSVFEATVRTRAVMQVDREMGRVQHPAVLRAIEELKETIENGGFGKVIAAYRDMDINLTTQVSQVRQFRNWVAHGRRKVVANNVDPEAARDRLRRYLNRLTEVEVPGTIPDAPVVSEPESTPSPDSDVP